MELPNSDILLKNVDIPLLRKQYEWLLYKNTNSPVEDYPDELEGLLNLLEHMLEQKDNEGSSWGLTKDFQFRFLVTMTQDQVTFTKTLPVTLFPTW